MSRQFDEVESIHTTGQEEKDVGFDVSVPKLKQLCLQYKRPYELSDGTLKFHINKDQLETIQNFNEERKTDFKEGFTFYAFPVVKRDKYLPAVLEQMLLVDVEAIHPETTVVYVDKIGTPTITQKPEKRNSMKATWRSESISTDENLDAYVSGERKEGNIDADMVFNWDTFCEKLTRCLIGIPHTELKMSDELRYTGTVRSPARGATTTLIGDPDFDY